MRSGVYAITSLFNYSSVAMNTIKYFLVCCFTFLALVVFAQEPVSHVVAKGETVSSIAKKYNVSEASLLEENPILKNYIYVGMTIRIPNHVEIQKVSEEQAKSSELPIKETVAKESKETNVVNTSPETEAPKKENNFKNSFFPERPAGTFTPHKTYGGIAFHLPTLEGLGDSYFAWGIDMTGFGYQFFMSSNFLIDASGHVIFRHGNAKLSKDWQKRTNEFAFHFPIMLGVEISGFQLRAGGFLEFVFIGWTAAKQGDTTTRTLYSALNPAPNRFHYGARFDVSFGFVDVGFILSWQSGVKTSTKALSVGFKF